MLFKRTWAGFVQSWVKITQARRVSVKFKLRCEIFILPTSWRLSALKNNPKKCFLTKEKGTRVKRWSAFEPASCEAQRLLCHKVNLLRCEARRHNFIMTCDIFGTRQPNILALCNLFGKTWPVIGPRLDGLSHLERLHGKIWPRLRGLHGLADPGYPPWRVTPPIM